MWLYQVFSCSMRDLVPWPGIEPRPPALGTQSLSHWTTRKVPQLFFLKLTILVAVCGGGGCWRPSSLLLGLLWADIFLISSSKLYKTIICSDKGAIEVAVCWSLSRVRLFVTPWTVARQALLSMGFSRQEYWSGLPFPSPVRKFEVSEVKSLSHVRLVATPWTVAYQVAPSMGFSRQEYWSGLPFPSPSSSRDVFKNNNNFKNKRALKMSDIFDHL